MSEWANECEREQEACITHLRFSRFGLGSLSLSAHSCYILSCSSATLRAEERRRGWSMTWSLQQMYVCMICVMRSSSVCTYTSAYHDPCVTSCVVVNTISFTTSIWLQSHKHLSLSLSALSSVCQDVSEWVCECVWECMCVCVSVCVCVYECACVWVCICMCVSVCVSACVCICVSPQWLCTYFE